VYLPKSWEIPTILRNSSSIGNFINSAFSLWYFYKFPESSFKLKVVGHPLYEKGEWLGKVYPFKVLLRYNRLYTFVFYRLFYWELAYILNICKKFRKSKVN